MAAIDIADLVVTRGGKVVLDHIDLTVHEGTVTGLLGPSGSGKTTLLRAIVGAQQHVTGKVTVLGKPAGSRELRAQLGYTTQAPSVYRDLSGEQNVHYHAALHGRPRGA